MGYQIPMIFLDCSRPRRFSASRLHFAPAIFTAALLVMGVCLSAGSSFAESLAKATVSEEALAEIMPGWEELYPSETPDAPVITPERKEELRDRGIYSGFGPRVLSVRGKVKRFHKGIDISAPTGSDIIAFNDGTVVFSSRHKTYGICVIVRQLDGRLARYAHMSKAHVELGDTVTRGALLGEVGRTGRATGPHLHFELIDEEKFVDPAEHVWLASELVQTPEDKIMAAKALEEGVSVASRPHDEEQQE